MNTDDLKPDQPIEGAPHNWTGLFSQSPLIFTSDPASTVTIPPEALEPGAKGHLVWVKDEPIPYFTQDVSWTAVPPELEPTPRLRWTRTYWDSPNPQPYAKYSDQTYKLQQLWTCRQTGAEEWRDVEVEG